MDDSRDNPRLEDSPTPSAPLDKVSELPPMSKYEGYVLISKSITRCIATVTVFGSLVVLFQSNPAALDFFFQHELAGLVLLGFITGIVSILWAKDPIRTVVKVVSEVLDDDDEEVDDEEENEEDSEEVDCEKCGASLEIYDPKPLCAECKAEVEYYAKRAGVREGVKHVEE